MADTPLSDVVTLLDPSVQATLQRKIVKTVDAVPEMNILSAQFNRTTKFEAAAEGLYFVPKFEMGAKIANISGLKMLPNPSSPLRRRGKTEIVWTYTSMAIGGQTVALTKNKASAVINQLSDEFADCVKRVERDVERQLNMDGRGILCVIESISGAPTYGVQSPGGLTTPSDAPGFQYLYQGMDVAFINPSTGLERTVRSTIDNVDTATSEVTMADTITGAQIGDYMCLCNPPEATADVAANNYLGEALGFLGACNSGDVFEDIDGAAVNRWNSPRTNAGGQKASEFLIATENSRAFTRSGYTPDLNYTTPGVWLDLCAEAAALKRFPETTKFKAGYEGYTLNGRKTIQGPYCAKGVYAMLSTEDDVVGMMDLAAKGWLDLNGSRLIRITGFDAYRADMTVPWGPIWFQRAPNQVVINLADNVDLLTFPVED